jgi:hypothetical protein
MTNQDASIAHAEQPLRLHARHLPLRWDEAKGRYLPDLAPQRLRLLIECPIGDTAGDLRRDVPVTWPNQFFREYTVRFVREETVVKVPEVAQ